MKKISNRIVFFGNERIATGVSTTVPTLTKLIGAGYDVAAVIVSNDPTTSRKQRRLEIADLARAHHIPVLLPKRLSEIREELQSFNAEIGILVAYGKMVPQSVIDIFPYGIVNIHPSLLPLHRGPTPIESVILNGEKVTGVSLMSLAKDMDAGPVYEQASLKLDGSETKQELADRLLQTGGDMLINVLPDILKHNAHPKAQNRSKATYDSLINKKDGAIDWNEPAIQIQRQIRAYAGWPGSRTILANKEVIITEANVLDNDPDELNPGTVRIDQSGDILVGTKDGVLAIQRLKPAGKQEMPATAFVAGHRKLLV